MNNSVVMYYLYKKRNESWQMHSNLSFHHSTISTQVYSEYCMTWHNERSGVLCVYWVGTARILFDRINRTPLKMVCVWVCVCRIQPHTISRRKLQQALHSVLKHPNWFCALVEDHLLQIRSRGAAVLAWTPIAGLHFQSGSEEPTERPGSGERWVSLADVQ